MKGGVPKAIQPPPPPPPKFRFPWLLFLFVCGWSWFVWTSISPELPESDSPPKFYSNQCQQDLRAIMLSAIKSANRSIHLVMFGLSDRPILSAISKKIESDVQTTIYYDTKGSPKVFQYLQGGELHPIKTSSLMHQKILILDDETVFIGSANMTSSSLRMHDNLVIGLCSRSVARFLKEHKPYDPGYLKTMVGGQEMEIWLLPDPRGHALTELKRKIKAAHKSIRIALFTFTHPALVEEVIEAFKRGVKVAVVIDMHSGLGASSKIVEKLRRSGINVLLSQGIGLLHHKFIYIDEETLVMGSANWTKAAFYKNSDIILALPHLDDTQKKFMNQLWRSIETVAK